MLLVGTVAQVSTLIQGLMRSRSLEHMGLSEVGTVRIPVQEYKGIGKKLPVAQTFDQQRPNGKYALEISDPGQRLVAQVRPAPLFPVTHEHVGPLRSFRRHASLWHNVAK